MDCLLSLFSSQYGCFYEGNRRGKPPRADLLPYSGVGGQQLFDQEVKNSVVWLWALTAATYTRGRNDGAAESANKV